MGLGATAKKMLLKLHGRDKQQEEVQQLQPVALAGASMRSRGRSELCSSFAATVISKEELEGPRRKAGSDGGGDGAAGLEQCGTCTRSFLATASRYAGFCSLDCKTASRYNTRYT